MSVVLQIKRGGKYTGDADYIMWNVTIQVAGLDQNTKRDETKL